ncbi:radical SAM family heme chaperone HemW [Cellulophaga baltica]|uniref:radical SAM family heme chaperone HemW n=1 Tax=Cellulophaga TaxID=104264 RepID=UPI001C06CEC6|nr:MULTISPECIES: radical SAM family heme chaperone HemW [Cellulophaga]MBU2995240.1 radical SAM family heme chaperone HemW [Cellulophaga baltica]MDO6766635.1 radical SAM family heme chaperone HemW [Cellulophaga sp. 1_MG-2023]
MENKLSSSFNSGGGIYIHIPFCKQACHYCDFHFSTSMGKKEEMLLAIQKELELRKLEFEGEIVETIYFGGGTPSVLRTNEIQSLINTVYKNFNVVNNPEITLEANPDDLSEENIITLSKSPINRLSIGVQSFFEEDLKLMNRAHSAAEADETLKIATQYFNNISIDLIYGMPNMTNERWVANIDKALSFKIPHISSYALTVEPKTALASFIKKGLIKPLDDALAQEHFDILLQKMKANSFVAYETSNFGKEGFFSKNNTAYWLGKKYIGVGPSAHSYDGIRRGWNVNNNPKYIKAILSNELPMETETLSKTDVYNEYVMTGLRTIWGVSLERIEDEFGIRFYDYLLQQAKNHIESELLKVENKTLLTTKKGKFLADGIASDLFMINLS